MGHCLQGLAVFRLLIMLVVSAFWVSLSGCSDGKDREDESGPDQKESFVELKGMVQKGPFTSLNVQAVVLNKEGEVADTIEAHTSGSEFNTQVPINRPLLLKANGTFTNELTGSLVTLDEPLEAFVLDPSLDSSININLFTHLVAKQTLARIAAGMSASIAYEQAQEVVRDAMGLPTDTRVVDLDILNIQEDSDLQDPNLQLLLFSAAVLNEWPVADGGVFGGAFFDVFVPEFAALEDGAAALEQLSPFLGLNAQALYEQVQNAGVITLPALNNELDNGQFVCSDTGECGWEISNTPSLALSAGVVYESEGQVQVRFRLSQASTTPLDISIRTVSGSAKEFTDYVPLATTITVPPNLTEFAIPLALLIDTVEEDKERFRLMIDGEVAGYELINSEVSILVGDGYRSQPADADLYASYVSIDDVCLQNISIPSQPAQADCGNAESFIAFHAGLDVAADISLALSGSCDTNAGIGCASVVENNHWLVVMELVELTDGIETASVELGVYHYGADALKNNVAQRFQMTLTEGAKTLLHEAHLLQEMKNVVARAKLLATSNNALDTDSIVAYSVGPEVVAEGISIQLAASGWQFTRAEQQPSVGCESNEFVLSGSFSIAGDIVNTSTVCIELDNEGQWQLASGEIPLAGDQIPLPAFHGMFVRYGDGRLVPKGGSTLLIPAEGASTEVQNIPGLSLPSLGLSRVYTGLQLPQTINSADIFIHKEGLPIAFKLIGAELTANGVNLHYNDVEYLQSGFSSVDIRDKGQFASNDNLFSGVSGSGELLLTANGLSGSLTVASGTTVEYAFPRGFIALQQNADFEIDTNSVRSSSAADAVFALNQDASCQDTHCNKRATRLYAMQTEMEFSAGGHQLSIAQMLSPNFPAFGAQGSSEYAVTLPDQLQQGQQVMLGLPGYVFSTNQHQNIGAALWKGTSGGK